MDKRTGFNVPRRIDVAVVPLPAIHPSTYSVIPEIQRKDGFGIPEFFGI